MKNLKINRQSTVIITLYCVNKWIRYDGTILFTVIIALANMLKKSILLLSLCWMNSVFALPTLSVVTEVSPPHQTLIDGEVAGISTELVRLILDDAGFEANINVYPWARAYHIADSQPNTLIYNMARTPKREHHFHWIGFVASYQLGFVSLSRPSQVIKIGSLDDAKQYVTAVQRGDFSTEWLIQQGFKPDTNLIITPSIAESWQLLQKGKVDLVIDDIESVNAMFHEHADTPPSITLQYIIPELKQQTWLAANIDTPLATIDKLIAAHKKVSKTELYRHVMRYTTD